MTLRHPAVCAAVLIAACCLGPVMPDRALAVEAAQSADALKARRDALRLQADAGDAEAQWELGMMLLNGQGGPADAVEARRYVRLSAESGYVSGQISMAVMLALGQGGAVDAPQARLWYGRAAEQNSAHALRGLGMMLITGEGGPSDPDLGRAYLELAVEAGEPNARRIIVYLDREGVAYDRGRVDKAKADWIARRGRPTV